MKSEKAVGKPEQEEAGDAAGPSPSSVAPATTSAGIGAGTPPGSDVCTLRAACGGGGGGKAGLGVATERAAGHWLL